MGRCRKAGTISLSTMLIVTAAVPFVLMLMGASAPIVAATWTNTGGGDHGGADWIITTNVTIADNHYNIGLFKIVSGVTVTVQAYNGASYGSVEIHAENIVIEGTLDAAGKGYPGGAKCYPGQGNRAPSGDGPGGGQGGIQDPDGSTTRVGGGGGGGYGNIGGAGGDPYASSGDGGAGGSSYGTSDASEPPTSDNVRMGSGGGGSNEGSGGRGGGKILLFSEGDILVSDTIKADGADGEDVSDVTSYDSSGGGGAGGGILLVGQNVDVTGSLSARGGNGGGAGNGGGGGGGGAGGRIKIVYWNSMSVTSYDVAGGTGGVSPVAGESGGNGANGTYNTQLQDAPPFVKTITSDVDLLDRDIDRPGSGAIDTIEITVEAFDYNGASDIDNAGGVAYITIFDPMGAEVINNSDISSTFSLVDENTAKWTYNFNPPDNAVVGEYDVEMLVRDENGLQDTMTKSSFFTVDDLDNITINIDNTSPLRFQYITVSGEASRTYGTATIDNAEVVDSAEGTLSASVTDVAGQPDSYTKTYQVNSSGGSSVSVYVWVLDDVLDGISATLSYAVRLQAPTLLSPDNSSTTTDNTPALSWENVVGAENYTVQYSTLENFDCASETSATENSLTLSEPAENLYYWRVKATTSAAGVENSAWSDVWNFLVDMTNPSITSFLINDGAAETTSLGVTLNISASDGGSGVYQICFKNEGGDWSSWESYSTSKSWTLTSGDGTKTVYAKVRDGALNESSQASDSITKGTEESGPGPGPAPEPGPGPGPSPPADTDPPTLAVLEPTTEVSENVTVRVSASDPSGIDPGSILMTLDGSTVQHTYSGGEITCSFVGLSAGVHLAEVRVSDASSNHNQAATNISFTVVAPVENVKNVENVTPAPTFTFQLLETPPEVENGYTQIMLWITNPTPQSILKHCELRFNNHVKSFDLEVAAGENALVTMWIDVAGLKGTYDVELYDADTNTVLDEGEITLLAAAEQLEVPQVAVTSPPPSPLIVAFGVVGVVVGLGLLRIARRLPKIKMPKFGLKIPKVKIARPSMPSVRLPSLPRLPKIKHNPKLEKRSDPEEGWLKRILERAREKELERARGEEFEFAEESPVVQDIYHLLEPAARELATGKKVGHLDHAVKPYKKRRR